MCGKDWLPRTAWRSLLRSPEGRGPHRQTLITSRPGHLPRTVGSEGSPSCTTPGGSGAVPRDEAHHGACRPTRSRGAVSAAGLRAASDESLTGTCLLSTEFSVPLALQEPVARFLNFFLHQVTFIPLLTSLHSTEQNKPQTPGQIPQNTSSKGRRQGGRDLGKHSAIDSCPVWTVPCNSLTIEKWLLALYLISAIIRLLEMCERMPFNEAPLPENSSGGRSCHSTVVSLLLVEISFPQAFMLRVQFLCPRSAADCGWAVSRRDT